MSGYNQESLRQTGVMALFIGSVAFLGMLLWLEHALIGVHDYSRVHGAEIVLATIAILSWKPFLNCWK